MPAFIHSSPLSLSQILVIALWLLGLRCSAMDLESLEVLLGNAVLSALESAKVTVKEAGALMVLDESTLRKAIRGEKSHHWSLNRLMKLPFSFWLHFGPTLLWLVAKRNAQEIAETVGLRRSA